jgi:hypothetical protein
MAFKKTIKTRHGIDVVNAYHRVTAIAVGHNKIVHYGLSVFVTGAAGEEHIEHESYSFDFDLDGANVIAQCYTHAKSLEKYATATDC